MGEINIFTPKGCYYLAWGKPDQGYWATSPGISSAVPYWYTSANVSEQDLVAQLPCFNNIKVASIIGENFGRIHMTGKALLGSATNLAAFEAALCAFGNGARASSKGSAISCSSKGGGSYKFLLTEWGPDQLDEQYNILTFHLGGIIV